MIDEQTIRVATGIMGIIFSVIALMVFYYLFSHTGDSG